MMTRYGGSRVSARVLLAGWLLLLVVGVGCTAADDGHDDHDESAEAAASEDGHEGETDEVVLDSIGIRLAGLRVGRADTVLTDGLAVTGTVSYNADRVSEVGPQMEGRVMALRADIGQRVAAHQVLALLESPEVGRLRIEQREATALARIAGEHHAREQRLEGQGISSRKDLLQAEAEWQRAEAALRRIEEALRALGATEGTGGQYAVVAPFAGTVVARSAHPGEMASSADRLFTVADLSSVWVELNLFERDLARVEVGQQADITVAAYPGRTFPGRIATLGHIVQTSTRTVSARLEVRNQDGALKPGMFAQAQIRIGGGGPPLAAVPQGAIQEVNGRAVVFVPGEHAGEFHAVPVEVGDRLDDGRVVIRSGLAPGASVVVAGAFTLRTELAKGEIGEHSH